MTEMIFYWRERQGAELEELARLPPGSKASVELPEKCVDWESGEVRGELVIRTFSTNMDDVNVTFNIGEEE